MSGINPVVLSHYDFSRRTCESEVVHSLANNLAPSKVFMLGTVASLPANSVSTLSNSLLTRNNASYLSAGQIRLDQAGKTISNEVTNPANLALAFVAPGLLARTRQLGTVAELSMASASGRAVVRGGATLMSAAGLAACEAAPEGGDYTSADASTLPPDHDVNCENVYDTINNASMDNTLSALVQSIPFPTLDVTHNGNNGAIIIADSAGNLISSMTPSHPIAWVKKGNKLFVLTANKNGNTYAPATLFVYPLNANNTLASLDPLPTAHANHKAILFAGSFNPTNMSLIEYENTEWLGISLGQLLENIEGEEVVIQERKTSLVDPSGPFNPAYNPKITPDFCALYDSLATDGGTGDASADAGSGD